LMRIGRGDGPFPCDAQNLAERNILITRSGIISACSAVSRVISPAIADADVKESILAEFQVACVMVPVGRNHVIDEYELAAQSGYAVVADAGSRGTVDQVIRIVAISGPTSRELIERIVEIDESIAHELRVDGDAK